MSNGITDIGTDYVNDEEVKYITRHRATPSQILQSEEEYLQSSDLATMGEELENEFSEIYLSLPLTGKIKKPHFPLTKNIIEILDDAIKLIDEVLEIYGDEIERINTFSLFEEKIKALWELREEANQNFAGVLILLEVAAKNSHYENYQKKKYQAIRMVLQKIKEVHITHNQLKESRKILMDNEIDIHAPIRNWDKYIVELKKISENK